jgi:hypothetical protein
VTNHGWSPSILRRVGCYVPSCASFVRRSALERVGGWREDLATIMDWDLWLRLERAGARFAYEPLVVSGFTRHPGQVTARETDRSRAEKAALLQEFGVVNPPWRALLARAHRSSRKTVNGGYLRELRARRLRGAPLTGTDGDPVVRQAAALLNPGLRRSIA